MATPIEIFITWLNNSKEGGQLALLTNPSGLEFPIVYNPVTDRFERIKLLLPRTIVINGITWGWVKGYTGSVLNTGNDLEPNDFIINAVIRNNNVNLYIGKAKYAGGDRTVFGTYSDATGDFTGANYEFLDYLEI